MFQKFRLFRKFKKGRWEKYSPEKRLKVAQEFENHYSKKYKRMTCRIVPSSEMDENTLGLAKFSEKTIYLNSKYFLDASLKYNMMFTLLHEGRHIFQHEHVNKTYKNNSKVFKLSKAYKWKNSLGGYMDTSSTDYYGYANQSIELDANIFAYKQLKKLKRKFGKDEKYIKEIEYAENLLENVKEGGKKRYGIFYKFKINRKNKKNYENNMKRK